MSWSAVFVTVLPSSRASWVEETTGVRESRGTNSCRVIVVLFFTATGWRARPATDTARDHGAALSAAKSRARFTRSPPRSRYRLQQSPLIRVDALYVGQRHPLNPTTSASSAESAPRSSP